MFTEKFVWRSVLGVVALGTVSFASVSQAVAAPLQTQPSSDRANSVHLRSVGPLGGLTDLAIQRLVVSDDVAASKFGTDKPIDDPVREQAVLTEAEQRAVALGLDPVTTVRFFQDQITASKIVQRGLFARWTAHPDQAPSTRPDLNQIRDELDQLTTKILGQLQVTQNYWKPSLTCALELTTAKLSGALINRMDALHRKALNTAVAAVCSR